MYVFCYTATSGYTIHNKYISLSTFNVNEQVVEAHNPWRCLTATSHYGYESMTISRTLIGWRVGHDNE